MRNWMTRLREMPDCWELKRGIYYSEINLCFLILSCLIFQSSVERGIPSFAAATLGPSNFPLAFDQSPARIPKGDRNCSKRKGTERMQQVVESQGPSEEATAT